MLWFIQLAKCGFNLVDIRLNNWQPTVNICNIRLPNIDIWEVDMSSSCESIVCQKCVCASLVHLFLACNNKKMDQSILTKFCRQIYACSTLVDFVEDCWFWWRSVQIWGIYFTFQFFYSIFFIFCWFGESVNDSLMKHCRNFWTSTSWNPTKIGWNLFFLCSVFINF